MHVLALKITLRLDGAFSLKDKRRMLKSIIERGQQRFKLSIAEVDHQDIHNLATIGAAIVSNNPKHGEEVLNKFLRSIESWQPVEVIEWEWE